jgi:hypothetical protein
MDFLSIKFTREDLDQMEANERIFLIQFGEFLNEINILYRCFFATTNLSVITEPEKKAKAGQLFFFIRLFASKLYEGWNILGDCYFGSKLSQAVDPKLGSEASKSLSEIKKYFGKKNNLYIMRNKMGFHYDSETVKAGLDNLEKLEEEELKIYLTAHRGNCTYALSDVIFFSSMRGSLDVPNLDEFLDHLMDEIMHLCGNYQNFGDECLGKIIEAYQGLITEKKNYAVDNIPLHSEIKLPFFIDIKKKD